MVFLQPWFVKKEVENVPAITIDREKLDSFIKNLDDELVLIKEFIKITEKSLAVYNEPGAIKIFDELFNNIKQLVTAEKDLYQSRETMDLAELTRESAKQYKLFKKVVPRIPLYFTKQLESDLDLVKTIIDNKASKAQNYRLFTGRALFKYFEQVIRDYDSFFMMIDHYLEIETFLAKKSLKSGQQENAKKALIRKRHYQLNSQPLLWQRLNLEKTIVLLRLLPLIEVFKEGRKAKRITAFHYKSTRLTGKVLADLAAELSLLEDKYSKNDEVVEKINNYRSKYEELSEQLLSILNR